MGEDALGLYVPVPPLQMPPPAPAKLPAKAMVALLAHTVPSGPAFTTGAGVKVTVRLLVAGRQVPLPVVVSTKVTDPLAISAAGGV